MVGEQVRAERERVVRAHVDAECQRDVAAALATFADPNYDVVALGELTEGADAVEAYLSGLFAGLPDFRAEIRSLHHADEIVFVDAVLTGTHDGPLFGIPATGRPVSFRAGCVFHFDGTDLVKETVYFDTGEILRDLGLFPQQGSRADRAMLGMMGMMIRARRATRRRRPATT